MPTDNLFRFIALEALGARVPTGHAALAIQHVDRVISDGLNEEPVAAVAGLGSFEAVFHTILSPPQWAWDIRPLKHSSIHLVPLIAGT
jgi:hypothetical protein